MLEMQRESIRFLQSRYAQPANGYALERDCMCLSKFALPHLKFSKFTLPSLSG
jgi:hypothetical protein